MNGDIYQNLMSMMGKSNPFTGEELHQNSSYNDLLFSYYHFYHKLGDVALKPNNLPTFTSIDRVIRELPAREKNLTEEARYHKFYAGRITV